MDTSAVIHLASNAGKSEGLRTLRERFAAAAESVSQDAIAELKRAVAADVAADAALNSAQALGDEDVSAERLKGNAWVDMIRTAARFVQSIDAQGDGGGLALDDRCPLCWQSLDEKAQARLQRFQQHLEGAARKAKEDAARRREELRSHLDAAAPVLNAQDEALVVQIDGLAERRRAHVAQGVGGGHRSSARVRKEHTRASTPEQRRGVINTRAK